METGTVIPLITFTTEIPEKEKEPTTLSRDIWFPAMEVINMHKKYSTHILKKSFFYSIGSF